MREKIAIAVCALALVVVVALSYLFAVRHNPNFDAARQVSVELQRQVAPAYPAETNQALAIPAPSPVVPASPDLERGRALYGQQGCAMCHAIAGGGNPRHPLDGTGDRWTRDELRQWILGTGAAADELSTSVRRRKQRYQSLPPEDLHALVSYLSSLKEARN